MRLTSSLLISAFVGAASLTACAPGDHTGPAQVGLGFQGQDRSKREPHAELERPAAIETFAERQDIDQGEPPIQEWPTIVDGPGEEVAGDQSGEAPMEEWPTIEDDIAEEVAGDQSGEAPMEDWPIIEDDIGEQS